MIEGCSMENDFIAKLVRTGDLSIVKKQGITSAHMIEPAAIKMFEYILKQAKHNSGRPVSEETLTKLFPEFIFPDTPDELSFYAQQLAVAKDNRSIIETITAARDLQQSHSDDPELVTSEILSLLKKVELTSITDYGLSIIDTADQVGVEYAKLAEGAGLLGYPYPWQVLSEATLGIQKGEFNLLAGRPKRYKTWLLIAITNFLHWSLGLRVLIFTKELTEEQMRTRIVTLGCQIDWAKYREGSLNDAEVVKLEEGLARWKVQEEYTVIRIRSSSSRAISEIEGYVEKFKPDFIGIDGLQLFANSGKWEEMTDLSRDLKQMFLEYNIASVCTTQQKQPPPGKKQIAAENRIAYTDAFFQDCDNLITIEKSEADAATRQVVLSLSASRNSDFVKFSVNTRPAYNFKQKRDLTHNKDGFDDIYEKSLEKADSLVEG